MANEYGPQIIISRPAAADLSALQYTFVKAGTTTIQAAAQTGQGLTCLGVLQNDPDAAGEMAEILIMGVSKLLTGGAFDDGAQITTGTAGAGEVAASADFVLGISLHGSTCASGDYITAAINCMGATVY